MGKTINIGKWEAIAIILNMLCVKIILNFPRNMAEVAGTAGWLVAIYISMLAFVAFYIIQRLYKKFEGLDLLDLGEHAAGGIGRIAVGLIVIATLIFSVSLYLRVFVEDMKVVALTVSPISYVASFFIICMAIGAYLGIEAIARYHALAIPVIIAGYIIIISGVTPYVDLSNIFPILGNGAKALLVDGSMKSGVYMEFIILFLLIPFIKNNKTMKSVGFISLGTTAFFIVLATFIYLTVIPMPDALERILPMFHLSRLINIGRFFQRIDAIFVLIWATAGLMYTTTGLYFIAYIFKKTFRLKHYRPLILPFCVILYTLSLVPDSLLQASYLDLQITRVWGWIPTFAMTILLLVIARFIKRKQVKSDT